MMNDYLHLLPFQHRRQFLDHVEHQVHDADDDHGHHRRHSHHVANDDDDFLIFSATHYSRQVFSSLDARNCHQGIEQCRFVAW